MANEKLSHWRDTNPIEIESKIRVLVVMMFDSHAASVSCAPAPLFCVGTRIRFLRTLDAPADEEHPHIQYAAKGELGTIAGHGTREGYWVKTDAWPNAFGASVDEFEPVTQNAEPLGSLFLGDCLEVMATLPHKSVGAIITDLPYGTTACKWDSVLPFAPMWEQARRVLKTNGAFVTFASHPFTASLVMSNVRDFRYAMTWIKSHPSGFQYARFRPMQKHEDVLVFGRGRMTYNPQMTTGKMKACRSGKPETPRCPDTVVGAGVKANLSVVLTDQYYPTTQLHFGSGARRKSVHPTQKPLDLMRYLVRTYTNPGDVVLDPCMGSGTTCLAAKLEGRGYIGIEREPKYFETAKTRIEGDAVETVTQNHAIEDKEPEPDPEQEAINRAEDPEP